MGRPLHTDLDLLRSNNATMVHISQDSQKLNYDRKSWSRSFSVEDSVFARPSNNDSSWIPGTMAVKLGELTYQSLMMAIWFDNISIKFALAIWKCLNHPPRRSLFLMKLLSLSVLKLRSRKFVKTTSWNTLWTKEKERNQRRLQSWSHNLARPSSEDGRALREVPEKGNLNGTGTSRTSPNASGKKPATS